MSLQGPDHDAFLEAARAEADTEFVLTSVPEVAQMFISPPFIAVRKQEPERFSVFGMGSGLVHVVSFSSCVEGLAMLVVDAYRTTNRVLIVL